MLGNALRGGQTATKVLQKKGLHLAQPTVHCATSSSHGLGACAALKRHLRQIDRSQPGS